MRNPCIAALCAGSVVALPSIAMSADESREHGVRNGSFREIGNLDWLRANPETILGGLTCIDTDERCDDPRLISIGRSVVHAPSAIDVGQLPLAASEPLESCGFPVDERSSVLRLRANHPVAPNPTDGTRNARDVVGNAFQTDIFLEAPAVPEMVENPVVLVRFDHFGLHPVGGAALEVRLIAERVGPEDCDWIEWGVDGEILPFRRTEDWGSGCSVMSHDMNVLGSPVYRCPDPKGKLEIEHWIPRQMPQEALSADDEVCLPSIPRIESLVARREGIDPPSAGWRTVEMRIAVDRLRGWDCDDSLDQIENYRFTLAFRVPQELMVLNEVDPAADLSCGAGDQACDWKLPDGRSLQQSWRFPAYSEVDQVEIRLADVDEFGPCDFPSGCDDGGPIDSSECRVAIEGTPQNAPCSYLPGPMVFVVSADGVVQPEVDSLRHYEEVVYDTSDEESTDIGFDDVIDICSFCNSDSRGVAYRPVRLQAFQPATPLPKACPGDFNGDGLVDGQDLGVLFADFNRRCECVSDLNGDGIVTGADLGVFIGYWGSCE